MKITIKIAKTISDCSRIWDELLPAGHHLMSRHLLAFENANIENIENNYLQVFLKDKMIGVVFLQKFLFKHGDLNFDPQSAYLSRFIKFILPAKLNLLVCGHLFRIDFQGFYFKNPGQQSLVFEAIELFTKQNSKNNPCSIIIKDCKEIFVEQQYKHFGYHFFNGDVTMEINRRAHWLAFDDYLNDLHKNYRQRANKIIKAFKGIEIKELNAAGISEQAIVIEKLYLNVVDNQSFQMGTVNAAYFYELKTDLQDDFEFHALFHENVMIGFYTFIFYEQNMETHFIGLDYEANKNYKIYFNILFLSIQKMIACKYDKLELGRTARDPKLNLGALPRQIFNYIKVRNPVIKIMVHYMLNKFNKTSNNNHVERNPLK